MTPGGTVTILHSFDSTDGDQPSAALVQAKDGNFYSTVSLGGPSCGTGGSCGTVFKITPAGKFTTLHYFDNTDGANPAGSLFQATNGNFYGVTSGGGSGFNVCLGGCGTIFRINVGLRPFVETLPSSGRVGDKVKILGTNLTGTTRVSFNGALAAFTVVSSSEITTTVPAGAKTGKIEVTTPGGMRESVVIFSVTPQITNFSPTRGPDGTVVTITGVSLAQTTAVTFGGVKTTSFTVDSDRQLRASVPTDAKNGSITITTPGGSATSVTIFTVT
jgi:uncharacterized repeat protein (TIGR03803 family)